MASSLDPMIIVLALGAGVLGFHDALRLLLDVAGQSPLTDIAICLFAMAVVTTQVLGATLLARFIRKAAPARAGGDAHAPAPRTDRFAHFTLVLSLAVAFLVSACLLVAPGAGARGLLQLVVAGIARTVKSHVVIAALGTGAAVVLPCAMPLLRVVREEAHSQGTAAATRTERFASMTRQVASFIVAAAAVAFLLAASGGLYIRRGSLFGVAAVAGTVLLARLFAFTRRARNAAGAGGRAAPTPAADTRLVGKLTRLAPYLAVVSFVLLCCLVFTSLMTAVESWTHDSVSSDRRS